VFDGHAGRGVVDHAQKMLTEALKTVRLLTHHDTPIINCYQNEYRLQKIQIMIGKKLLLVI
jgi:hypothetical protein